MPSDQSLTLELLPVGFGAIVQGIDLRGLTQATWLAIRAAWLEHALLIFPAQGLTQTEQNDFARRFGALEFEAIALSNIDKDGHVHSASDDDLVMELQGNEIWHLDSTYMGVQAKGAVFSAEIVPSEGGATGWADMRQAYDALDSAMRERIADLTAYHSYYYSQGRAGLLPKQNDDGSYDGYGYHDKGAFLRPLVKHHPETGRPSLNIGRHAHDIVGMNPVDSTILIDQLNLSACAAERTYFHDWSVGDVVVWDNRCLMHRGSPYDMTEPRRMWHTRIAGEQSERALNG